MKCNISAALSILLCVLASCEMPSSGRGQVAGVVTSSVTGEPVEGVRVRYSTIEFYTDETGRYLFESIPEGLQGITFSKTGFTTLVSQVDVQRDAAVEHDVSISVMTGGWAVGAVETDYATIFHTNDGGQTWVRQGSYSVLPPDDLNCVCAVNQTCCWTAGDTTFNVLRSRMEFSILKTSDGGTTWRRQGQVIDSLAPSPIVCISAVDTSVVYAVTDTNIVLRGTGGGTSWELCRTSEHTARYSALSTCDGIHIWAGGSPVEGGSTGLDYSGDGGDTWQFVPLLPLTSGGSITAISAVDTDMVYVSGNFGVRMTCDRGKNWKTVQGGWKEPVTSVSSLGSYWVWAGAGDGTLRYSPDAFESAYSATLDYPCTDPAITAISFLGDASNGALTYVSSVRTIPGGILCTVDGGDTWFQSAFPYKAALRDISFAGTKH